jgi:ribonuclease Y
MQTESVVLALGCVGAGFGVAFAFGRVRERALKAELSAREKDQEDRMRRESEAVALSFKVAAQDQLTRDRAELDKTYAAQRQELALEEKRLRERESLVNRQIERLASQETEVRQRAEELEGARGTLEKERTELRRMTMDIRAQLERIGQLDSASARTALLKEIERESARDAADLSRHILEDSRQRAEAQARKILATAVQRYAGSHTFETTTATVALSGEEMKGRIIGREGRNIRAFEAATGVTVLVDDTPNAVVLSGFDPVRREIARQAMERLILDGRIHPTRIEEVVAAVTVEMDAFVERAGEEATSRVGIPPVHPDVAKMLGRLHFRHSYSQNVLQHSLEVAHLCGLMAAELGENIQAAKRAGLLHDIGKAMTHEIEGPHAIVGADFIKRFGEPPDIVNGVASHHEEVPHENLLGILVAAADAISAARPGSRSESMTTYLQRLERLEQVAREFAGVEKAFAVQAGRELRVFVRPAELDDSEAYQLAQKLARKIEEELVYPGQIRITVIRETRSVEYAK